MKLFGDFEAVRFPEENLVFITQNGYLYYIYNPKNKIWKKYRNAGNDRLTIENYQDIGREEIIEAMNGIFPKSETDFMRLCDSSQLCIRDMMNLLNEEYPNYMTDETIDYTIHNFLLDSDICHKSYSELKKLLDNALTSHLDNRTVLYQIKELCFEVIGRDIFKKEIKIVDGHDTSSYFWIMPVRVIDYSNTDDIDNVSEMRSVEISIEEDDVNQYLTPFLYKYFDDNLEANKRRVDYYREDNDGNEQNSYINGFEWYLTPNFYTFDSITNILNDIYDTIDALSTGRDNEYTAKLKEKRGTVTYKLLYAKDITDNNIKEYNDNRPTENETEIELIIDFYRRFIYRMEYMMKVGKEKGYNLISFMGP